VAGSSGKISGGALNHPVMYVSLNNLGSMVLDISGDTLDAKFLRENGVVADSFSIVKVPPTIPPTVTLTAPANGASYAAPASIALAANASDDDGTVVKVEFFQSSTLIGTDTTAPYGLAWTGVPAGSYTLTARATDDDGATTTSAPVNVSVVAAVPAAPDGLTATAISKSRIDLAWNDRSANETGFKIERSMDDRTYQQIAVVAANLRTYASTGLKSNKRYYYRIRASGAAGDSAYSNTASAVTPRR
jgi:chitinase